MTWREEPRTVSTAPKRDSKRWKRETTTWLELEEMVRHPSTKKECGNYLLGELKGDRRLKTAILSRNTITLDLDDRTPPDLLDIVKKRLSGTAFLSHTTYNSTPNQPRYRLLVPLDREVLPDEYQWVSHSVMESIGIDYFDPGSSQPERYMFRPSAKDLANYEYHIEPGEPLVADDWLADFEDDLREQPSPTAGRNKRNPFDIDGTVGAFNRAYSIEEAIEAFDLPYESAGAKRWHLVGAKAVAGVSEVAPGLVYSHHATDPAWGKTCSAFDLVRLHMFGDMDEGTSPSTPVNRLPSHQAMLELVSKDARVLRELMGDDFSSEIDDIADQVDRDWKTRLRVHPRTGVVLDTIKNWDLIVEHEKPFQVLSMNELTLTIETHADLPWRSLARGGSVFSSADRAELYHHLERNYGIRPSRTLIDELVLTQAYRRLHNPVQEYLNGLEWDGVDRLETALPGVVPTPYTRMVARKSLVASVARMFDPGVKWDHVPVLQGPQGLGKTTWIARMARGHVSPLGRIGDKDTLLAAHRSWFVVADEGWSMRKSDNDLLKEFLTRTHDVFRMPYDRETQSYPRRFTVWSTTNDTTFLRNEEGNRRYLPVQCTEKVDFLALTDDYVDQVWAEAVHLYRAGEPLWLDDVQTSAAEEAQAPFVEEDAEAGLVQDYLEQPVPEDWDMMSPEDRYQWRQDRASEIVPEGTVQKTEVCSAQIWVEVFGRRLGEHRRADLLLITSVLKRLPDWEATGQRRVKHYGPQLVFRRKTDGEDLL